MASRSTPPIGTTIAAVLVFGAAFMPWGSITAVPTFDMPGFPGSSFTQGMFASSEMTLTVTGWNGKLTIGALELPNWAVVLAAACVAAFAWARAYSVGRPSLLVLLGIALYGVLHSIGWMAVALGSGKGSLGIGVLLTTVCFVGMIVPVAREIMSRPEEGTQGGATQGARHTA